MTQGATEPVPPRPHPLAPPRPAPQTALMILERKALTARAEGRHLDAVDTWREALRLDPDDWRVALELRQDLSAAYHYSESDPQFRRAARHLPDREWLEHYAERHVYHASDLDVIDARGRALLARTPDDPALHDVLGKAARQRRDWDAAVTAFGAALALVPGNDEYAAKLAQAKRYQTFAAMPDAGEPYAVLVLNLDRNPDRWEELQRQFRGCRAPVHRLAGVEGARLAPPAVQRLTGQADAPRGTLGCFLSHAAAWQAVLDRGLSHALVVEDDVMPLVDLPARITLPPGYDVCFANSRLNRRADAALTTRTLLEVMQDFPHWENAPGGDGYFVSAAGARALLDLAAADGFADDLDWRLLAYGIADAAALAPGHAQTELTRLHAGLPDRPPLAMYGMSPALIHTVGVSSDREDQNRLAEGKR